MSWDYIYMFEIVKKCKISFPAQDQQSSEHYRNIGPLVVKSHGRLQSETGKKVPDCF